MSDFSNLFKKNQDPDDPSANMNPMPVAVTPDDSTKLAAYSKALDATDPKPQMKQYFDNMIANTNKAQDIAAQSNPTPEDQAFLEKQIPDPLTRSVMGGGVMGGISSVGKSFPGIAKAIGAGVQEAAPAIENAASGYGRNFEALTDGLSKGRTPSDHPQMQKLYKQAQDAYKFKNPELGDQIMQAWNKYLKP